ncbi:hypothetical protein D3C87_1212610 [compost metagenome]
MKKVILTALVAIVAVGGAFAGKHAPVKTQAESEYTYYEHGICDTPITCSDEGLGALCSEYFESTVLYNLPGCNVANQVTFPLGKLPN